MSKTPKAPLPDEADVALFWLAALMGAACVFLVLAIIVSQVFEEGKVTP